MFSVGPFTKLKLIIVDERIKQRFTGQQQVVALPFVSFTGLIGCYGSIHPIFKIVRVFVYNSELTVQETNSVLQFYPMTRCRVISARHKRSFTTGYLHPAQLDILFPCFTLRNSNFLSDGFPCSAFLACLTIESVSSTKEFLVDVIYHDIANP